MPFGVRFERIIIEMWKIVEYLALPGIGKTWQLGNNGYCARQGATSHHISEGWDRQKFGNTAIGLISHPWLFCILLYSSVVNYRSMKHGLYLRPIFVTLERIGRCKSLKRSMDGEIHLDEGVLQFLWRTFCEKELSPKNLQNMDRCIQLTKDLHNHVAYFSCDRSRHLEQVRSRYKKQAFDISMQSGDVAYYLRCRSWMCQVLLSARRSGIPVCYIRISENKECYNHLEI